MDQNENDSSDESLELFPIEVEAANNHRLFKYEDPSLFTGILKAITEENFDKIKELFESGRSLNINDNNGNTPLHITVLKDNLNILKWLINQDSVMINTRNFFGETPLYLACKYDHFNAARILIDGGANVNLPDNEDVTPLHISTADPALAHLLIKNGAFIDAVDYSGDTPLHEAVSYGCLEVTCMLLYYNADANTTCSYLLTPFMRALINGDCEIQTVLLEYVDDFCARTNEDMCILALGLTHQTPFLEEFIKRGANINYHLDHYAPYDAFDLCLSVPDAYKFNLIWDHFINLDFERPSIIQRLCDSTLSQEYFIEFLNIIINSKNIETASAVDPFNSDLTLLIRKMVQCNCSLDYITKVVLVLFSYGLTISSTDLVTIFELNGYSELFRLALYMRVFVFRPPVEYWFPYLLCQTAMPVNNIVKKIAKNIRNDGLTPTNIKLIMKMTKYCAFSKIYEQLARNTEDKSELKNYPQIPLLVDISRNVARDLIIKLYNIKTSCQYLTVIDSLDISKVYKDILKYQRVLYEL